MTNEIIKDAFKRISEVVHNTVDGLSDNNLVFRPNESANSIAWLVWHLTRVQDDHIAKVAHQSQVWSRGWYEKFDLPLSEDDTGYGHKSDDVASIKVSAKLLLIYFDEVHEETIKYINSLDDEDYKEVVDENWDPPVTLAARIVSVISDDLQHAGQAAYVKGLL